MHMDLNKRTIRKILGIIAFAVVLYWVLQNHELMGSLFHSLTRLLSPFTFGASVAFILNVPMRLIEHLLFPQAARNPKKWYAKMRRPASLAVTTVLLLGVIATVMILVIPEMVRSIGTLTERLPESLAAVQVWIQSRLAVYPELAEAIASYSFDLKSIGEMIAEFLKNSAGNLFSSTFSFAASVFSGLVTFILGVVFAYYILAKKELLGGQVHHLMQAYLPAEWVRKILSVTAMASSTFARFITGQCLEAVILGSMFLVTMLIFGFPYAMLISVLIAFTALIPMVGAFIGCIVGIFLIMIVDPIQAFWFLILFLTLQQLEENLIYPRVVGNSVGLPSIWVLFAITIGGSLYGIIGMLVFIPLCSVLYALLRDSVHQRLSQAAPITGILTDSKEVPPDQA